MDLLHAERIGPSEQPVRCEGEGWDMSSYASYCQDQGIDCARRARLARSPEIATYWRSLGFRWLRLAEQLGCQWDATLPDLGPAGVGVARLRDAPAEWSPPIRDARFVDLNLAALCATPAGAKDGFAEPRDRQPKSTLSRPQLATETGRPAFEPAKMPANCELIRQRPGNIASHRTAWWARQDSNL